MFQVNDGHRTPICKRIIIEYGSVRRCSAIIGMNYSKLYRICTGKQNPTVTDALKLAEVLKIYSFEAFKGLFPRDVYDPDL